jgi:hypothetical protein
VKKLVSLALLIAPASASAQVPGVPPTADTPRNLDPGAPEPKPAPPPAPTPAKPNVIVVGPDGKVTYDNGDKPKDQPLYYGDPSLYDEPDDAGPTSVHSGPTPDLHVVRKGDTLWDICFYYFNNPWEWPKVWSYNPAITNPHWIYPGDLVRLLPRGVGGDQPQVTPTDPEGAGGATAGGGDTKPVDNLPLPTQNRNVGLKQTAFVEKADLDKSIKVDGGVEEKELLTTGDSIYLSYPPNNPPKVGQRYSIYRPDNSVKSDGKNVGSYVRIVGTLEVASVKQDKRARAVITESSQEIERGDKVGPLLKQFKNVTPVPPKVDAQGSVVAMLTKDQLIGRGEVVFIDLGKKSGIEPGNRLFVVRRGDALPPKSKDTIGQDDRRYPARTLGEVVVVEVGENISIALVTLSVQEMGIGDLVIMQKQQ